MDDLSHLDVGSLKERLQEVLRLIDSTFKEISPVLLKYSRLRIECQTLVDEFKRRGISYDGQIPDPREV